MIILLPYMCATDGAHSNSIELMCSYKSCAKYLREYHHMQNHISSLGTRFHKLPYIVTNAIATNRISVMITCMSNQGLGTDVA